MIFNLSRNKDAPAERPDGVTWITRRLLTSAWRWASPRQRAEKLAEIVQDTGAWAAWVEVESDLEGPLVKALRERGITPLRANFEVKWTEVWSDYLQDLDYIRERTFLSWEEM